MPYGQSNEPEGVQMIRDTGNSLARIAAEYQAIYADSLSAAAESAARSNQLAFDLAGAWLQAWTSPEAGRDFLGKLFDRYTRVFTPVVRCAADVPERLFRAVAD